MSSRSPKQARFMAMIAHTPGMAKKTGVPKKVAVEFNKADAGTGIIKPKRKTKKRAKAKFAERVVMR